MSINELIDGLKVCAEIVGFAMLFGLGFGLGLRWSTYKPSIVNITTSKDAEWR
jgi:hypothetical protein